MEKSKIIINIIIYVVMTSGLLYVLIKEDNVSKKMEMYRNKFTEQVIKGINITKEKTRIVIKNTIWLLEFVISTAVLLIIIRVFYIGNFVVPTGSMIPAIMENDRLFANMAIYRFRKPKIGEIFLFREPVTNKDLYTKRVMGLPGDEVKIENDNLYINNNKVTIRNYSDLGKMQNKTWIVPKKGDKIVIIPKMDYKEYLKNKNIDVAKIQKHLLDNFYELDRVLPDIETKVNGIPTGMILDFLYDSKSLDKLMNGETLEIIANEDYYLALGDNTNNSFDSRMWGFVSESRIKGKPLFRFWPVNRAGFLK
ncbi:signal peptidase I [Fusobacterium sp. PH5-44]|uniref:signal peptidase I n=1 Tax=unclassified Fusobacterium TaxID=2648384 RepID=UPI003D2056DD